MRKKDCEWLKRIEKNLVQYFSSANPGQHGIALRRSTYRKFKTSCGKLTRRSLIRCQEWGNSPLILLVRWNRVASRNSRRKLAPFESAHKNMVFKGKHVPDVPGHEFSLWDCGPDIAES